VKRKPRPPSQKYPTPHPFTFSVEDCKIRKSVGCGCCIIKYRGLCKGEECRSYVANYFDECPKDKETK